MNNPLYLNLENEETFLAFDYDEAAEAYNFMDIGEFSFTDTIEIENFIHSLSLKHCLMLMLRAMGYNHKEIKDICQYGSMNIYYVEATMLRNKYKEYKKQQELIYN